MVVGALRAFYQPARTALGSCGKSELLTDGAYCIVEKMPDLVFACPVPLSAHYDIPVDTTGWANPLAYWRSPGGKHTPHRPKAPFGVARALKRRPDVPHFDRSFGVYMLAADHPRKAFYVGIASEDTKSPEGVGKRIRKHRVKLTASHVGKSDRADIPITHGGVDHTGGWRPFAIKRYRYHSAASRPDACADVRLMVGKLMVGGQDFINAKATLEQFERAIHHNADGIRDRIFAIFWPDEANPDVDILNSSPGPSPDTLPGAIILPENCGHSGASEAMTTDCHATVEVEMQAGASPWPAITSLEFGLAQLDPEDAGPVAHRLAAKFGIPASAAVMFSNSEGGASIRFEWSQEGPWLPEA